MNNLCNSEKSKLYTAIERRIFRSKNYPNKKGSSGSLLLQSTHFNRLLESRKPSSDYETALWCIAKFYMVPEALRDTIVREYVYRYKKAHARELNSITRENYASKSANSWLRVRVTELYSERNLAIHREMVDRLAIALSLHSFPSLFNKLNDRCKGMSVAWRESTEARTNSETVQSEIWPFAIEELLALKGGDLTRLLANSQETFLAIRNENSFLEMEGFQKKEECKLPSQKRFYKSNDKVAI